MTHDPPVTGYLVTNHLNLFHMLTVGLILSDSGFGNKYYQDPLSLFPGHIPLFTHKVPQQALARATAEAPHLLACVARVDISRLRGAVAAVDEAGTLRRPVTVPDGLTPADIALLVPAPLPLYWIDKVFVETDFVKKEVILRAGDLENVTMDHVTLRVNRPLFKQAKTYTAGGMLPERQFPWAGQQAQVIDPVVPYSTILAAGGMLGMLHALADRSDDLTAACRAAFSTPCHTDMDSADPVTGPMGLWLSGNPMPAAGLSPSSDIFWNRLVTTLAGIQTDHRRTAGDLVIDLLTQGMATWPAITDHPERRRAMAQLTQTLTDLSGMGDLTVSHCLASHKKWLSRALILFVVLDTAQDLLTSRYSSLSGQDLAAAAILAGARDKWPHLPAAVTADPDLARAVGCRMAGMAHHLTGTGIDLGPCPARPKGLRELFATETGRMSPKQQQAAILISTRKQWACVDTVIDLPNGTYQLRSTPSGMQLVLAGVEKKVTHQIDSARFQTHLDEALAAGTIDNDLRKVLRPMLS